MIAASAAPDSHYGSIPSAASFDLGRPLMGSIPGDDSFSNGLPLATRTTRGLQSLRRDESVAIAERLRNEQTTEQHEKPRPQKLAFGPRLPRKWGLIKNLVRWNGIENNMVQA